MSKLAMDTETPQKPMNYKFIHDRCTLEFRLDRGSLSNPTYLPQDLFHQLSSRDRVKATIEKSFGSSSAKDLHELVEYAHQNPHIFLTLVSCRLVKKLPSLRGAGVRDDHLPLAEEYEEGTGSNRARIVSLNTVKLPPNAFVEGDDETDEDKWDLGDLQKFIDYQWMFYAVVFHRSLLLYTGLHPKCPLPFVKISADGTGSGNFGKVFRVGLNEKHLTSTYAEFPYLHRITTSGNSKPLSVKNESYPPPCFITPVYPAAPEKRFLRTHAHIASLLLLYPLKLSK
ncbi:hypothetical protein KVR01_003787 [Diaporthe batatas]|uniref:uncharacterized protein n=1 Tax=Diaporthe batatas TaxID=748121 RepID=UPI001D03B529|nr:uncharacterized protein KVR01_003787 [Diaporthe batatas]KAG8168098.1 hypothetical protein KVR01_003787 [Diaporthe batatas]